MKKQLLPLLILATTLCASAQRAYINDDTARYILPTCCDSAVGVVDFYRIGSHPCTDFHRGVHAYAGKQQTVYGALLLVYHLPEVNLDDVEAYLRIYQQGDNRLQQTLLDSVRISQKLMLDAEAHPKYFRWRARTRGSGDELIDGESEFYEVYFKEPVIVHDTFNMICGQDSSSWFQPDGYCDGLGWYNRFDCNNIECLATSCEIVYRAHMYAGDPGPNDYESWLFSKASMVNVFPILLPPEIDPEECAAPPAPQLTYLDLVGRQAVLFTHANPDVGDQQLTFGPWPSNPDSLTIYTNPGSPSLFLNLTPDRYYAAWDRNQCAYRYTYPRDTAIWTPWSEPRVFYLPSCRNNTDTLWLNDSTFLLGGLIITLSNNIISIDGQTHLIIGADTIPADSPRLTWLDDGTCILDGRATTLSTEEILSSPTAQPLRLYPNPCGGELSVETGAWQEGMFVEIIDLTGNVVHSSTLPSPHSTLNISALPAGTYLVRCGSAMKKLVVK